VVLVISAPLLSGGLPLGGPAAAVLERAFGAVAGGGMLIALTVAAAELFSGRTYLRALRLAGASMLMIAAGAGLFENSRSVLRPGTASAALSGASDAPADNGGSMTWARLRLAWCALGLIGATLILGGGLAAVRAQRRAP